MPRDTKTITTTIAILILVAALIALAIPYQADQERLQDITSYTLTKTRESAIRLGDTLTVLKNLKADLEGHNCSPRTLKQDKPEAYTYYTMTLHEGIIYADQLESYLTIAYKAHGVQAPDELLYAISKLKYHITALHNTLQARTLTPGGGQLDCRAIPDNQTIDKLAATLETLAEQITTGQINTQTIHDLTTTTANLPDI